MDFLQAIILGIVEGITEFLPISSTFHLIFASKLIGVQQNDFAKLFEVFIQSGAILSVVVLYFGEIIKDRQLIKKTLVAFIPTALVGFVLYKIIKELFFDSSSLMVAVFIGVGAVFIIFEYVIKQNKVALTKTIHKLSYKHAIIIGFVQALAVMPGVSRAGAVLIGMMVLRYKRDEAAKFSFILAVPTIFAASFFDLYKNRDYFLNHGVNLILLVTGFLTAFVTSYIGIKWLINYLRNNTLTGFGTYRIIVGLVLILITLKTLLD